MKPFKVHDTNSASPEAGHLLSAVGSMIGFVPNVFAVIAESAPALHAFVELNNQLAKSDLTPTEREVIQTAVSVENLCTYCVAGHTAFSDMQDVSSEVIEAVRNNQPIDDPKLETLNQFTRTLSSSKGVIPSSVLESFLAAGYTPANVMEVIVGICVKTFSNLTNNTIGIPLDDEFSSYAWQPISDHKAA